MWTGATVCPSQPTASARTLCTGSCSTAGRQTQRRGPPSSSSLDSSTTISFPPSPATETRKTSEGGPFLKRKKAPHTHTVSQGLWARQKVLNTLSRGATSPRDHPAYPRIDRPPKDCSLSFCMIPRPHHVDMTGLVFACAQACACFYFRVGFVVVGSIYVTNLVIFD